MAVPPPPLTHAESLPDVVRPLLDPPLTMDASNPVTSILSAVALRHCIGAIPSR